MWNVTRWKIHFGVRVRIRIVTQHVFESQNHLGVLPCIFWLNAWKYRENQTGTPLGYKSAQKISEVPIPQDAPLAHRLKIKTKNNYEKQAFIRLTTLAFDDIETQCQNQLTLSLHLWHIISRQPHYYFVTYFITYQRFDIYNQWQ